ncbi:MULTISPECIES: hypothetical protein [Moorena]|nr:MULTISPECIES: hypothetical protein [Moorena]NEP24053.1 hypothetical protein [Moorena sp. SIO3I6]
MRYRDFFLITYSLLPTPYSLLPIPCSLYHSLQNFTNFLTKISGLTK